MNSKFMIMDNGGKTADRYTIAIQTEYEDGEVEEYSIGLSEHPFDPQGFYQHDEFPCQEFIDRSVHITWDELPKNVKAAILMELDIHGLIKSTDEARSLVSRHYAQKVGEGYWEILEDMDVITSGFTVKIENCEPECQRSDKDD